MKLKYYLRGIGIGLIITTLVMTIAFMLHKDDLISDDEVRERAAALGMVMPGEETGGRNTLSNNTVTSPEPIDASSPDKKDDGDSGSGEDDKSSTEQKDDAKKDDKSSENDDKAAKEEPKEADVTEEIELSIVGGEYSDIVSQKLYKAGLIEDAEEFNKYLAEGGYDNLIQPGTYMIPVGVDYATIVSIITEKD